MTRPPYPRSPGAGPASGALSLAERDARQMDEAGRLNRYLIGYGEAVEADWAARGLEAPDLPAMQR